MKTKITIFLCLVFLSAAILSLTGCGKYDDGPKFSLRSKKARISNAWTLKQYYFNGVSIGGLDTTNTVWTLEKDYTYYWQSKGAFPISGTWNFSSDKESLIIRADTTEETFKILRLKNSELWLEQSETLLGITIKAQYHFEGK